MIVVCDTSPVNYLVLIDGQRPSCPGGCEIPKVRVHSRGRDARTILEKPRVPVIFQYDPGGRLSYGINSCVWFSAASVRPPSGRR